jgi:hypothetical protein
VSAIESTQNHRRWDRTRLRISAVLLAVLGGGCGPVDSGVEGPLPNDPESARAFAVRLITDHPDASPRPPAGQHFTTDYTD